ncbi:nitroreductase family protein [Paenibacillus validus]|uniref:Nitroreductase n=1 Tax=Paenibacillus validus TaxID=44253 RepID=A0A7X3CT97_9BACL|nr:MULTISPECIES: nitroreductase family protein [Paenibacillus]MED4599237.1 nitroreductase family protein [Paenibacillus validus]MED4606456.1 nitroreductase family protein [Paenibacillus validus]MUG71516.1 nitroreductase [Paenibacillus validus]
MAEAVGTGKDFLTAVRERRTIYGISQESPISDERIVEIIREAVKYTPSAFNSQSARVLVLLGEQHHKLWDLTKEILRGIVQADQFASTEQRINGFRSGHGTVLYFEDMTVIEGLQASFPSYSEHFPSWSQQSNGMLQFVIWTALENEGLGASVQHYNPLIDEKVKTSWIIPQSWKLIAQMPFGKPTAPAGEKEFKPLEERIKVSK